MVVESRRYRRAAHAYLAAGGTLKELREATACSVPDLKRFLAGELGLITGGRALRLERLFPEHVREWVRESPSWDIAGGQVPSELIAPVIEEAFATYGRLATAEIVGLVERQLYAITTERRGTSYELADMIVARLRGPTWWWELPERRRWYWGADAVLGRYRSVRLRRSARARQLVPA